MADLAISNVDNSRYYIYNSVNGNLSSLLHDRACQFYDSLRNHFPEMDDSSFAHLILPIARFVIERFNSGDIKSLSNQLAIFLKSYIGEENGSYHFLVPENVLQHYPVHNEPLESDIMSVLACEFMDYFQETRSI